GYPPGSVRGRSFYLATIEYRLPLWDAETGYQTLPLFLDRVHGAVFTDLGDAPNGPPRLEDLRGSIGAELRADLLFGYYAPVNVRFGYARGLTKDGTDDVYLVLGGTY